jgi:hypothetical protein
VRCPDGVHAEERGGAASDDAAAASVRRLAGDGGRVRGLGVEKGAHAGGLAAATVVLR